MGLATQARIWRDVSVVKFHLLYLVMVEIKSPFRCACTKELFPS